MTVAIASGADRQTLRYFPNDSPLHRAHNRNVSRLESDANTLETQKL